LRWADLSGADLKGANLEKAFLREAKYDDRTILPISEEEAQQRGMVKK